MQPRPSSRYRTRPDNTNYAPASKVDSRRMTPAQLRSCTWTLSKTNTVPPNCTFNEALPFLFLEEALLFNDFDDLADVLFFDECPLCICFLLWPLPLIEDEFMTHDASAITFLAFLLTAFSFLFFEISFCKRCAWQPWQTQAPAWAWGARGGGDRNLRVLLVLWRLASGTNLHSGT